MENFNDNSKTQKSGEFRLPRDVNRRLWLLKKIEGLKNKCPTRIVPPYSNNPQRTLPVSIDIKHYNNAVTNNNALLSNQTSTTASETGNVYFKKDHNVSAVNDLSPNYVDRYDDVITISQGSNDRNKNITDHGNHSSAEKGMGPNQEQTNNIRGRDLNTTDTNQASVSKLDSKLSSNQFNKTLHGNSSIGENNNLSLLRNVRKNFQQLDELSIKHNLPISAMPERPKYNLLQNSPATLPNEGAFKTTNYSGLHIHNKVHFQETPSSNETFEKEIQTIIEVQNQGTHTENDTKTIGTQTENMLDITEEQSDILEFVLSNDVKLEHLQKFIKNKVYETTNDEILNNHNQQTNNEGNLETDAVLIKDTEIDNKIPRELIAYSDQYKLTLKVMSDLMSSNGFKIISEKANEPIQVKLNTIIKYLQIIYNNNPNKVETNKRNEQSEGELNKKKRKPNNVNEYYVPQSSSTVNENKTSTTDRNKTATATPATVQQHMQSTLQHRAPFMHDTPMHWSPKPNHPQHLQPHLPSEYPRMMLTHMPQQPEPSVSNDQYRLANQHAHLVFDRQQSQVDQDRYRQMGYKQMAWESHMANYANDMGG